jgi:alanine dehydrogenase
MKVLLIGRNEIEGLAKMKEFIQAVENAFRSKSLGKVQMPAKFYVFFKKYEGDFRTMPAYMEDLGAAGVKIVNVHPNNPKKYNLPTVMATILLLDPKTGRPISIMDGTWITSMRTGAAGGVAAKYLAKKNSKVVGLIGAGAQARTQLLALNEIFKIEKIKIWSRSSDTSKKFVEEMKFLKLNMKICNNIADAAKNCDILVTTTPAIGPVVKDEWIENGIHINAIGADAPGKEELEPKILKRAKVVVDDREQAMHSGEINVPISKKIFKPRQICSEIGDVVAGKKKCRTSDKDITIFDSTGLAIQDVASAWMIYQRAKQKGIGKEIEL